MKRIFKIGILVIITTILVQHCMALEITNALVFAGFIFLFGFAKFARAAIVYSILVLPGCNNGKQKFVEAPISEKIFFFPVTTYFKGQIAEMGKKGVTPLKYTTINKHTDSVWLKAEELDEAFQEFLTPVIDTNNLTAYFKETKFFDQTINAFTFTYAPIKKLPDTLTLIHWDVYIDPDKNGVKKIYLVKKYPNNKTVQLTWYSDKYCKILTINNNEDGISTVTKEEKISWDF
jgi:hypothetical protein